MENAFGAVYSDIYVAVKNRNFTYMPMRSQLAVTDQEQVLVVRVDTSMKMLTQFAAAVKRQISC